MSKIEWKYVSPIKNDTDIDVLEIKYHFPLPADLKNCIVKNNGGMPDPAKFDIEGSKDRIFGGLISFNKNDIDNIYDFINLFVLQDGSGLKMFPFGLDPFGNFYCIKDNNIVFYDHESDKDEVICESFSRFVNLLHP